VLLDLALLVLEGLLLVGDVGVGIALVCRASTM
jgi:hypothetical protein